MRQVASVVVMGATFLLTAGCVHFTVVQVSPGIFEGPKPRSQNQFDALRARGVRTILSLEMLPWDVSLERCQAREYGIDYRDVPILASPLPPSEKKVKEALLLMHDHALRPIYLHCFLSRDRAKFIVGLYRVYYQDWPPGAAWAEMLRTGFHDTLRLRGFTTYFWHHTQKPAWVLHATQPKPP